MYSNTKINLLLVVPILVLLVTVMSPLMESIKDEITVDRTATNASIGIGTEII